VESLKYNYYNNNIKMKIFIKIIIFLCLVFVLNIQKISAEEKIKIGLLVPITGQHSEIGKSIIKSVRLAINKIDNPLIEILPRDTQSNPSITLRKAKELNEIGVKIIIGPVFNKNLIYLDEIKDVIFLSLTNKIINNPKNIISTGINSESQFNSISKFQKINEIKKTIILIPKENYKEEIEKAIQQSKIKVNRVHYYESDPTKLTNQIEEITKYFERKQNLENEIKKLEKSDEPNKKRKIEDLKKLDTLGKVNFDAIIISDFDESLKSITTSLLYTDVSPKDVYFITLNQWFDESLLKETSSQPIYFPSINKENYDYFIKTYHETFNEYPNQLSFLSYDLIGLVYYLIVKNNFVVSEKMFLKKNMFKGKIGIFDIKNNKINHILNFYKVENGSFKKIF
jgi:hypothetical protein